MLSLSLKTIKFVSSYYNRIEAVAGNKHRIFYYLGNFEFRVVWLKTIFNNDPLQKNIQKLIMPITNIINTSLPTEVFFQVKGILIHAFHIMNKGA